MSPRIAHFSFHRRACVPTETRCRRGRCEE